MRLLIVALITFSFGQVKCQTYVPMLGDNSTQWTITSCLDTACVTSTYFAKRDTSIGGNEYKFLIGYHFIGTTLIREDEANKQVYLRPFVGPYAHQEVLVYDFSLNVGDPFHLYNPNSPLQNDAGLYYVDSISPYNLLDGPSRIFYLSDKNGLNPTLWVEGVGSLSIINTPGGLPSLNDLSDLSCFYRDGVHVYESDTLPGTLICKDLNTSVYESFIEISPTIFQSENQLHFEFNHQFSGHIELYGFDGRLISNESVSNSIGYELNLPIKTTSGLIIKLVDVKGRYVFSKKFVTR